MEDKFTSGISLVNEQQMCKHTHMCVEQESGDDGPELVSICLSIFTQGSLKPGHKTSIVMPYFIPFGFLSFHEFPKYLLMSDYRKRELLILFYS